MVRGAKRRTSTAAGAGSASPPHHGNDRAPLRQRADRGPRQMPVHFHWSSSEKSLGPGGPLTGKPSFSIFFFGRLAPPAMKHRCRPRPTNNAAEMDRRLEGRALGGPGLRTAFAHRRRQEKRGPCPHPVQRRWTDERCRRRSRNRRRGLRGSWLSVAGVARRVGKSSCRFRGNTCLFRGDLPDTILDYPDLRQGSARPPVMAQITRSSRDAICPWSRRRGLQSAWRPLVRRPLFGARREQHEQHGTMGGWPR